LIFDEEKAQSLHRVISVHILPPLVYLFPLSGLACLSVHPSQHALQQRSLAFFHVQSKQDPVQLASRRNEEKFPDPNEGEEGKRKWRKCQPSQPSYYHHARKK
jgi:hypothetical protein